MVSSLRHTVISCGLRYVSVLHFRLVHIMSSGAVALIVGLGVYTVVYMVLYVVIRVKRRLVTRGRSQAND